LISANLVKVEDHDFVELLVALLKFENNIRHEHKERADVYMNTFVDCSQ